MTNPTMEDRAKALLEKRETGLTYHEVGEAFGISGEAARSVIRRFKAKMGMYSDDALSSEASDDVKEEDSRLRKLKVLTLDIENAPAYAMIWRAKNDFISSSNVFQDPRILCFAAKWIDGPVMFSSEWGHGRDGMLKLLWELLDKADIVVTYNGDAFDLKWINSEFHTDGLPPVSTYKSVDLIKTVRKHMGTLMYKKLDYVADKFIGSRKIANGGIQLWKDLLLSDDPQVIEDARSMFKDYNKQDVVLTEELYFNLLPWIDGHPPIYSNMFTDGTEDDLRCRRCGSTDITRNGWHLASMFQYPRYRCNGCSGMLRTISGSVRLTDNYTL